MHKTKRPSHEHLRPWRLTHTTQTTKKVTLTMISASPEQSSLLKASQHDPCMTGTPSAARRQTERDRLLIASSLCINRARSCAPAKRGSPPSCQRECSAAGAGARPSQKSKPTAEPLTRIGEGTLMNIVRWQFVIKLNQALSAGNTSEVSQLYDRTWPALSNEFYKAEEWPRAEVLSSLVRNGSSHLTKC